MDAERRVESEVKRNKEGINSQNIYIVQRVYR